jgi:hypothetical protein
MLKRFFAHLATQKHGQSFVELMLLVPILALMLTGVVEFGMLLNNYLKVLAGTREGARLAGQMVAFKAKGQIQESDEQFYVITASKTMGTMTPIELNGNSGDDLIISVFSVVGTSPIRFPLTYTHGWSLCSNYTEIISNPTLVAYMKSYLTEPQYQDFIDGWDACTIKQSNFTTVEVSSSMVSSAFNSGVVLVEVYYNYPQMLKMPIFEQMGDPIPVYTYSMMPMSAAIPTSVPASVPGP